MIDLILQKQPNHATVSANRVANSNRVFPVSMVVALLVAYVVCASSLPAQDPLAPSTTAKAKQDERPLPPPANISLETKDNVVLKCTYFAAPADEQSGSGKSVIPFILIHDWEGSRADLLPFAEYLQSSGYAVIVPDLRGHGESVTLAGAAAKLDYTKFRKSDMVSVLMDIERCKKYLVQRNNEGELNIDLLNIVAVGKSAVFAIDWTISDWSWPNRGPIKQGQDVKALTLISPEKKAKNIGLSQGLRNPMFSGKTGKKLPTYVLWSAADEVAADDSYSIYQLMEKGRPDFEEIEDPEKRREQETLFKGEIAASRYTGTELIRDNKIDGLWKAIANFVETKVGSKRDDYRWQSRERD